MKEKDINMTIKMGAKSFEGIYSLHQGHSIDEQAIDELCQFVDERYDCADFRVVVLLKTIYAYSDTISQTIKNRIKESILNFKYWHDEPGDDSLCTWSENHQLIFHTCEYLAGHYFPEAVFTNASMTGIEHIEKAKPRLLQWFDHKFKYGFIEWHSNTYYEEDIAPLALLIDHAPDDEIRKKATIIMDLLLLDMAMYSFDGYFSACSGRCYEDQKKDGNKQDTLEIYKYAFGQYDDLSAFDFTRISSVFILCQQYQVPQVLKEIANDKTSAILKDSMGLNLSELKTELDMKDMDSGGAFMWQMEAFTNPETINLTMDMFNTYKLYKNDFLKDLKMINIKLLRKLNLLPLLVKILNPTTQGVAIQRNNSYTYKTQHYMLSTAMRYHPGEFGDQHHIWHATMPNNIHVFTTHPAAPFFDDNARNFSPSYWVGNGILPDSVQNKQIHMSIYKVNQRGGFLERSRPKMTHGFFPRKRFDQVIETEYGVYGRIEETYVALRSLHPIRFINEEELVQEGEVTAWVCEMGDSSSYQSLEGFVNEIIKYPLEMKGLSLKYKKLSLTYKKYYKVNGKKISTQYHRLDTPYCKAKRKPEIIKISWNKHQLTLCMDQMLRRIH